MFDLGTSFIASVAREPQALAIIDGDVRLTYAEWLDRISIVVGALDDMGLNYICQTYERFYAVGTVLSNMVQTLADQQSVRLLKHVVRCFLRLSDNQRAREALRQCLPEPLRDATFSPVLRDDAATKRCLAQLLINLSDNVDAAGAGNGSSNGASMVPNQGSMMSGSGLMG